MKSRRKLKISEGQGREGKQKQRIQVIADKLKDTILGPYAKNRVIHFNILNNEKLIHIQSTIRKWTKGYRYWILPEVRTVHI